YLTAPGFAIQPVLVTVVEVDEGSSHGSPAISLGPLHDIDVFPPAQGSDSTDSRRESRFAPALSAIDDVSAADHTIGNFRPFSFAQAIASG
ncbi:MAG: hypothetical protein ACREP0_04895, partial [Rhodanobacteraceae bacterium]